MGTDRQRCRCLCRSITGKGTLLRLGGPGRALPASSEMADGRGVLCGERTGDHRREGWAHAGIRSVGANGLLAGERPSGRGSWRLGFSFVSQTPMLSKWGLGRGLPGKEDKWKMWFWLKLKPGQLSRKCCQLRHLAFHLRASGPADAPWRAHSVHGWTEQA